MKASTAEFIVDTLSHNYDLRVIPNYSGRSTFGFTTCAVASDVTLPVIMEELLFMVASGELETCNIPTDLNGVRSDNLGKGYVLY